MAKKKGGDYEGWLLRLIDKVEDIGFSFNLGKWIKFAESKILGSGFEAKEGKLTAGQIDALAEFRGRVFEIAPTKLNIRPEYITRFREAKTGRFSQAIKTDYGFKDVKTGRFVKVTGEVKERYRTMGNEYVSTRGKPVPKGGFVDAKVINAEIRKAKENKTWLKGEV